MMELRPNFKYHLYWHTRYPKPEALASNTVFYRHLSMQQLKEQLTSPMHPRILATEQDFVDLRRRVDADKTAADFYRQLYAQAEQLLQTAPPKTPERHTLQNRLLVLCLVYKICGERRFFDRAWQELDRYCSFSTWMYNEKLDAGYILKGIAIGYDWLYHDLSEQQRETIHTAVLQNAFWSELQVYRNPYLTSLDSHYVLHNTNHNVSINCGMMMAACALFDAPALTDICAEIVESALWALENYLPEFLEHGCGKEGVYYWYWPTTSVMEILFALKGTFGTDFGISQTPGFDKMSFFPVYMTGASGKEFNWGNAWEDVFAISESLFAFSTLLGDEQFAYCRLKGMEVYKQPATPYDLLWYRPLTQQAPNLPLQMKFDRTESVGMFSAMFQPDATSVCIKGGYNNEVHTSLCAGSFVIDAQGERWASLPGGEKYNVPDYWDYTENGRRWTYYRMRAEGQNAMVLNPSQAPDQYPFSICPVTTFRFDADSCKTVLDLSDAFRKDARVSSALRGAALTQNRSVITLQDEVTGSDIDYWWMMQTTACVEIAEDGQTAILRQNGKQMFLHLACDHSAKFEVMPAQPLDCSPHPAENSENTGLQKLVVHLPQVNSLRLTVQFSPAPTNSISVTPLCEW